jgi:hypothetical protein
MAGHDDCTKQGNRIGEGQDKQRSAWYAPTAKDRARWSITPSTARHRRDEVRGAYYDIPRTGDEGGPGTRPRRSKGVYTRKLLEHVEMTPTWVTELRFNTMAERIEVRRPPWPIPDRLIEPSGRPDGWRSLTDADLLEATVMLQSNFPTLKVGGTQELLSVVANRNAVHPVRAYLDRLHWDGAPRLHKLFLHYFPARLPRDPELRQDLLRYLEAIGPRFAIGAVARVRSPGCKVDNSVAIVGPQNLGKSSGIRALVPSPELFTDDVGFDLGDKDTKLSLIGVWLVEFAEGAQLGNDERKVKAFLSRQIDRFRLPYGRLMLDKPRQSVLLITSNKLLLRDRTGNRRYWPFEAGGAVNVDTIVADRDQLWAEAVVLHDHGMPWWLTPELEQIACEQQRWFEPEPDHLVDEIRDWVERHDGFSIDQVLHEALGLTKAEAARSPSFAHRIADALRDHLGCERARNNKRGPLRNRRLWFHMETLNAS